MSPSTNNTAHRKQQIQHNTRNTMTSTKNHTETSPTVNRRFCTAPMMDWSDSACRVFWRALSKHALLYTEMITTGALIHGDRERFLHYEPVEHPLALQLGGSNPSELAQCARFAEQYGYDEVNLNVGCPSDRVQNNLIGACLMAHPQMVADAIKAMQDACGIDVTVKHRIGIDEQQSYEELAHFVSTIADVGCKTFIVHARIAILSGLSPKENRDIPPLKYDFVYRLKRNFPQLEIIINGGITSHDEIDEHLKHVDGVMLGREAYQRPAILHEVDARYFGQPNPVHRKIDAVRNLYPYIETVLQNGGKLNHITRHMLGLFHGEAGARQYRRYLSENAFKPDASLSTLDTALSFLAIQ